MTLPRFFALSAYWKKYPPTHVCAAALAGIKASEGTEELTPPEVPDFALLPEYEE